MSSTVQMRQQVFEIAAKHLIKQGVKAKVDGACAYRGDHGTMCAVGVLIPDKYYSDSIEGHVPDLIDNSDLFPVLSQIFGDGWDWEMFRLLVGLQNVHDDHAPCAWEDALKNLAAHRGLDGSFIDHLPYGVEESNA